MTTRHHASTHARKKSHHSSGGANDAGRMDAAIYIAFIMVGAFVVLLLWAVFDIPWRQAALGCLVSLTILVNYFAVRAYLGKKVDGWQKPLARLPLRFAGFGPGSGRPLHAASGDAKARGAVFGSLAVSAVLIAAAALIVFL